MRGRTANALYGVLYLVIILAVLIAAYLAYDKAFTSKIDVDVTTNDIGSAMQPGSDVKVRGVVVGSVSSVGTADGGAVLGLELDPDFAKDIPADSKVQLLPKTLFGERYVAIIPGAGGEEIRGGDTISQDTSARSVELETVFDRLLPVLQAVQPEKLSATLGELAASLRGNGENIGTAMVSFSTLLKKANPKMPELADDLDSLARVADDYNEALPDLLTALDDFTTTSQTLVQQRETLLSVFETVTASSNTTTGFVSTNEQTIIGLSQRSRKSLEAIAPYASEFPCLFSALEAFVPRMDKVLGQGSGQPGIHARLSITPQRGAYGPGDGITFSGGGPSCPTASKRSLGGGFTATPGSTTEPRTERTGAAADSSSPAGSDLGSLNSPAENELIAELMAPTQGMSPGDYPKWGSLLVGPLLRGSEVTIR